MKKLLLMTGMLLLVAAIGWAAEEKTEVREGKPYFEASDNVNTQATVLKVTSKTRALTLKTEAGDTVVVNVSPEVKTFGQIKAGDQVKIAYSEKVVISVQSSGAAEVTEEQKRTDAEAGQKPSATLTARTHVKATVTAIDTVANTATLKGVNGREVTVTARNPSNLRLVKVGDVVSFTYTSTLAASVEKVPAKTAAAPAKK